MTLHKLLAGAILSLCLSPCSVHAQAPPKAQLISLEEARPVLSAMSGSFPAELKSPIASDPAQRPASRP